MPDKILMAEDVMCELLAQRMHAFRVLFYDGCTLSFDEAGFRITGHINTHAIDLCERSVEALLDRVTKVVVAEDALMKRVRKQQRKQRGSPA